MCSVSPGHTCFSSYSTIASGRRNTDKLLAHRGLVAHRRATIKPTDGLLICGSKMTIFVFLSRDCYHDHNIMILIVEVVFLILCDILSIEI